MNAVYVRIFGDEVHSAFAIFRNLLGGVTIYGCYYFGLGKDSSIELTFLCDLYSINRMTLRLLIILTAVNYVEVIEVLGAIYLCLLLISGCDLSIRCSVLFVGRALGGVVFEEDV